MLAPDDSRHGSMNGYTNWLCRCQPCRDEWAAYCQRRKAERPPLAPDDPRHGKASTYGNWNCRCSQCTRAWADATRERSRRRSRAS
jgi:hypothetical protein